MNRQFANGLLFKNFQLFKGLFTEQECDKIVSESKKKEFLHATVVDRTKSSGNNVRSQPMTEVRVGHLFFVHQSDTNLKFAFDRIFKAAALANFGWGLLPPEFLQITEYDKNSDGGFYKRHRDIIIDQNPQRIISCVAQLSKPENYTGCELVFDKDSGFAPSKTFMDQGDAVFFLADEPHEVTPITSGVRYSLVAWLTGPPLWTRETLPDSF